MIGWIALGLAVTVVGLSVGWVAGSVFALMRDDSTDLWDDEDVYL